MKKHPVSISHEDAQVAEFKKNPKRAMAYLNAAFQVAFEENDAELVLTALATVARARGMTSLAKETSLQRESLHRMLSRKGNPEWKSIFAVMKALHLRPTVTYDLAVA